MLLLTDVDNKKKSICYTGDSLNSKKEKKLIDCGVRNGLQRIMWFLFLDGFFPIEIGSRTLDVWGS